MPTKPYVLTQLEGDKCLIVVIFIDKKEFKLCKICTKDNERYAKNLPLQLHMKIKKKGREMQKFHAQKCRKTIKQG